MSGAHEGRRDEASVVSMMTALLRNRWRIVRWILIGTTVAVLSVFQRPALYVASASFYPQSGSSNQGGALRALGQIGISLPGGSPSQTPAFYQALLKSRVLFAEIARDSLEVDGRLASFLDLFEITGETEKVRIEEAVDILGGIVGTPNPPRNTQLVSVTAATEWPEASLFIVSALVEALNRYNMSVVQGQAGAERRFVEGRLALASTRLRAAEDDLESFLRNNRQFDRSPELSFQRERLERSIGLRQGVFTSLTQMFEDVRIREVRDIPVISMVEQPSVPTLPGPRGRGVFVVLGFLSGAFLGAILSLLSEELGDRRRGADTEVHGFLLELNAFWDELRAPFLWLRRRRRG
jgi:uncharacterized protein involved in exopolysaccharide biosynthesis